MAIKDFNGSLDEFLDSLENFEGMQFDDSLNRVMHPKNPLYGDPVVRLYKGNDLVASTVSGEVSKGGARCVRDFAYLVLKGLKEYGTPTSLLALSEENIWEVPPGEHTKTICFSLKNLSAIGVVAITGEKDRDYDILKVGTTAGFRIEYRSN